MTPLTDDQIRDACLAIAEAGNKILAVKVYRVLRAAQYEPGIHESAATINKWLAEPKPTEPAAETNLGSIFRDVVRISR